MATLEQTTYKKLDNVKSCPFCGSSYISLESAYFGKLFTVYCHECFVKNRGYMSEEDAIAAWNTRASNG